MTWTGPEGCAKASSDDTGEPNGLTRTTVKMSRTAMLDSGLRCDLPAQDSACKGQGQTAPYTVFTPVPVLQARTLVGFHAIISHRLCYLLIGTLRQRSERMFSYRLSEITKQIVFIIVTRPEHTQVDRTRSERFGYQQH